jgi:hypothetical protein
MTSEELTKMRIAAAARAHDAEKEFGRMANKAAIDSATETLKAIVLINGGSCVAILTFIGTLATKDTVPIGLATPLIWFAIGLGMAVIASAFGYFTNLFIAGTSKHMTPEYEQPFLRDNDDSKHYRRLGEWARWSAVIAAFGGIVAFWAGLYSAYGAFQHLPN